MADRQVKQTRKDSDGDITALCNSGKSWSPRSKANAIRDIETETHTYTPVNQRLLNSGCLTDRPIRCGVRGPASAADQHHDEARYEGPQHSKEKQFCV